MKNIFPWVILMAVSRNDKSMSSSLLVPNGGFMITQSTFSTLMFADGFSKSQFKRVYEGWSSTMFTRVRYRYTWLYCQLLRILVIFFLNIFLIIIELI